MIEAQFLLELLMGLLADPPRLSFAFTQFLEKAISDSVWARLVVQSSQAPTEFARGIRAHLRADLAEAINQGRLSVLDVELAADIVIGISLQVMRGSLERRAARTWPARLSRPFFEPLARPSE